MKKQNMWSFSVKREVWKKFWGVISLKFDKNKNIAGVLSFVPFHDGVKSLDWKRIVKGRVLFPRFD